MREKKITEKVSDAIFFWAAVVLFLLTVCWEVSYAGDLHCNGNMISVGDSIADLRASCPPPIHEEKSVVEENINWHFNKDNIRRTSDRVTKTVYSLSFYANPGEFIREVVVVAGTIVEINITNSKLN